MSIINKNIRETKNIDCEHIDILWLSISKSYFKILNLLYIVNNTNCSITSDIIEGVLKETHIFNNVVLTFKPHIIKALNNLDSAVICVDIWDLQNSSKAKSIINCWFNIGYFITTIHGTNMSLGVLQCKNCWK